MVKTYGQKKGEEVTPEQRAEYIRKLLNTSLYDEEDAIRDLLADLMHFCDSRNGLDFEYEVEVARRNYEAEVAEPRTVEAMPGLTVSEVCPHFATAREVCGPCGREGRP